MRERVAQRHLAVKDQWNASLLQKRRGSEAGERVCAYYTTRADGKRLEIVDTYNNDRT